MKTTIATLIKQVNEADFLNVTLKEKALKVLNFGDISQVTEFANKFLLLKKTKEEISKKRNLALAGLALFFSEINKKQLILAKKEMLKRVESAVNQSEKAQVNSLLKSLDEA